VFGFVGARGVIFLTNGTLSQKGTPAAVGEDENWQQRRGRVRNKEVSARAQKEHL
jgi:hypothetical protein